MLCRQVQHHTRRAQRRSAHRSASIDSETKNVGRPDLDPVVLRCERDDVIDRGGIRPGSEC